MRLFQKLLFGVVAMVGLAMPVLAAERAIIVLDASGSMWAQIEGKARITIARETLESVLSTLSPDIELGLMTYGHREKGNCDDIEMLVEPTAGSAGAIKAAVADINPKGMTPLSDAVRLAAEDLKYTEEQSTVILITDGLETCEVDPCALGTELEQKGVNFTVHVLGFGLSDDEGKQVACLAENTGGQYLSAQDGASLVKALTETVAQVAQAEPAPEPVPEPTPVADFNVKPTASLSEGGPDIGDGGSENLVWEWYQVNADGTKGEWVGTDYYARFKGTLEPGDYIMKASFGYASVEQPVNIVAGKVAEPHFVLNGAYLKLHPRASEGAAVDGETSTEINSNGAYVTTDYGDVDRIVPAGNIAVTIKLGAATVDRSFTVAAGETVDEDVLLGAGIASVNTEYVEGLKVEDADVFVEIFKAEQAIDGTRESVTYGYGPDKSYDLPAGDYVAVAKMDAASAETPFTVEAGAPVDVTVYLGAGVLVLTVPEAKSIEIVGAKADIQGNREMVAYGYETGLQKTLPAGDYVVVAEHADGSGPFESPVTVKAGERNEYTIEAAAAKPSKKK